MIHHMCVGVKDYEKSRDFYQQVLGDLGYQLLQEFKGYAGFGTPGYKPGFWITTNQEPSPQVHICFEANTREDVNTFYSTAMGKGAKEDTPPGLCEEYHPSYYAAFVYDLDGYKIEAVCLPGEL